MSDAPPSLSVPPPVEGAARPVLDELLANGWLAGHGTTQQLESFLDAMRGAVAPVSSAVAAVRPTGSWAPALPSVPEARGDDGEGMTRGS